MKRLLSVIISVLITVTASGALSAGAVSTAPLPAADSTVGAADPMLDIYAERVAYLVNSERKARGIGELIMLPELNKAATVRANEIVRSFDHTRPNGTGFYTVLKEAGFSGYKAAENIAAGQTTPEHVMKSWMNSDGHRNNILNSDYNYIGVSVVYENGRYHWTQLFLDVAPNYLNAVIPVNYGDVNGDGRIDAVDASSVLAEYAAVSVGKPSTFTSSQRNLADMNKDGRVDAVDASTILSIYAVNSVLK